MQNISTILQNHSDKLPINIVAIARDLEVEVYAATLHDATSGLIKKTEAGGYAIFVNDKHSTERKRFTIAHELAHFILHKEHIGDGIYDDALYRSGLQNWMEAEANKLAADLLMPTHHVKRLRDDSRFNTVKSIAKEFRVSEQAMAIRLGVPN